MLRAFALSLALVALASCQCSLSVKSGLSGSTPWTAITINGNNNVPMVVIASGSNSDGIYVATCTSSSCTAMNSPIHFGAIPSAGQPVMPSVVWRNSASNNPFLAFYDQTNNWLDAIQCKAEDCSTASAAFQWVRNAFTTGNNPSLIARSDAVPLAAFGEAGGTHKFLGTALCTAGANCASGSQTGTVADNSNSVSVPALTSMVNRAGDLPIIAYVRNSLLYFFSCTVTDCSTGTVTATTQSAGLCRTSIILDTSGYPLVALCDTSNNLIVWRCADANCLSGSASPALDTGLTPAGTGLQLNIVQRPCTGPNYPLLVYHNATTSTSVLRVFDCSATDCSTGTMRTITGLSGGQLYPSVVIPPASSPIGGSPIIAVGSTLNSVSLVVCPTAGCDTCTTPAATAPPYAPCNAPTASPSPPPTTPAPSTTPAATTPAPTTPGPTTPSPSSSATPTPSPSPSSSSSPSPSPSASSTPAPTPSVTAGPTSSPAPSTASPSPSSPTTGSPSPTSTSGPSASPSPTSATTTNPTTGSGGSGSGSSVPIPAIVGGVVGGLLLIAGIAVLVWFLLRRRKPGNFGWNKRRSANPTWSPSGDE